MSHARTSVRIIALASALAASTSLARAQCPELGPVQNYTGAGTIECACFVAGEEALSIFTQVPAADFPITITKIAIAWGSQNGGTPPSVEDSLVVYTGNPTGSASPAYQYFAPQLSDGYINEFDITTTAPVALINSGPFAVGLRFYNTNDQSVVGPGYPSTIEDGNGCTSGKNKIKAISGLPPGFYDFCALGGSGDWVIYIKYTPHCGGGGGSVGTPFCFGDGSGATCPCGPFQSGGTGEGCQNSTGVGAIMSAAGTASVAADTVKLHTEQVPATTNALFFQGIAQVAGGQGALFGDGLRCINSSLIRLGTRSASGGIVEFGFGIAGDPLVSVRGALPGAGGTRYYQTWYRNAANFCTASTFNLTNGLQINWTP